MKLHLGCSKRYIPGYIHVDAIDFPHIDHVSGIDRLSFIGDSSVEVIYNCHVLDHFNDRRNVEHADVDDYSQAYVPHMDKTSGVPVSLNVECEKGHD